MALEASGGKKIKGKDWRTSHFHFMILLKTKLLTQLYKVCLKLRYKIGV